MDDLKLGVLMFFYPVKACALIKRRRDGFRPLPVLILVGLALLVRVAGVYTTSFTVASIRPQDANLLYETGILLVPFLAWVLCSYAILSIMSGETKLTENLTACSYCLVPYIVITPLLTALSHMVSTGEAALFDTLSMIVLIWVLLLLFTALKSLNDIHLGRALFIALLSVMLMLILAAAVMLVVALISQVVNFAVEIVKELRL
mgnify:CR=1 FL=1